MKLKNILFSFLAIVAFFAFDVVNAASTAPDSYIVNGSDWYEMDTSDYLPGGTYDFFYKKNANGDIIYCLQSHYLPVTSGSQKYTLSGEASAKFAYAIANGYPNKSITGDAEKDYFITALAVFYLVNPDDGIFVNFNLSNGTYRGSDNYYVKEMAKLVNAANSYSYTEPSIKLNAASGFALSSDKKYYVSSELSVSTSGIVGNYTVNLNGAPSGTIVTDTSGNVKNTFGVGEKFLVKVPVSSISNLSNEFGVSVSATGTINKAYIYVPENDKYQNTAALYADNKGVSSSVNLKLTLTTEVQISKIDATTGEELPGATLTVKDSDGNEKDTWVSSTEVHVIKGLKPGKYTLTEEIAPEGYELSTETITFEVKADGTVTKVTMKNKPEDKKYIYISKQDITTGEELAGAHLELKDEDGNLIEAWVSQDIPHIIEKLDPGKYYLTEVIAPDGYELSTETVEFIVKEDGTVDGEIIMYNKPETIVKVPSTSSFKTITSSLIGIIIIGLGAMIIYKNYKKNEEY